MESSVYRFKWHREPYGTSYWLSAIAMAYTFQRIYAYQNQIDAIPIVLGALFTIVLLYNVKKVRQQDAVILTRDTLVGYAPNSSQFVAIPLRDIQVLASQTCDVLSFTCKDGSEVSISMSRLSKQDKAKAIELLNERLPLSIGDI